MGQATSNVSFPWSLLEKNCQAGQSELLFHCFCFHFPGDMGFSSIFSYPRNMFRRTPKFSIDYSGSGNRWLGLHNPLEGGRTIPGRWKELPSFLSWPSSVKLIAKKHWEFENTNKKNRLVRNLEVCENVFSSKSWDWELVFQVYF